MDMDRYPIPCILAKISHFFEPLAEAANLQRHLGIAKTIKAMVYMHTSRFLIGECSIVQSALIRPTLNPK